MISIARKPLKWIIFFLMLAALVGIIITVGVFNSREGDQKLAQVLDAIPPDSEKKFSGIQINAVVTNIDAHSYQYSVHMSFEPMGSYADPNPTLGKSLNKQVSLSLDDKSFTFYRGETIQSQDFAMSFSDGDNNHYPFDRYLGDLLISASYTNEANNVTTLVPLSLKITGLVQGWRVNFDYDDINRDRTALGVIIYATRSYTQRAFAIYICIIMWGLSLCAFAVAMTFHLQKKKIIPHAISLCTGMLFALPRVRLAQPGIPPIGCTADIAGYFWNILLVCIGGITLLASYIYQTFYSSDQEDEKKDKK